MASSFGRLGMVTNTSLSAYKPLHECLIDHTPTHTIVDVLGKADVLGRADVRFLRVPILSCVRFASFVEAEMSTLNSLFNRAPFGAR
ncbi:hypothetical protein B296_00011431 [Ensete ventricosum]|uniref:Uncharacterized protein n=1 Tax=Ensete ventricosum TaxID=4639 RepID=A0A427B612_ENSVE|nr:hypothetical protein B296_00011431 [Ensete ventricosum]